MEDSISMCCLVLSQLIGFCLIGRGYAIFEKLN
jgi:hypothetical protein